MEDRQAAVGAAGASESKQQADVDTTSDLIAGWLGGAVGILVSNPLEVLKVRLQTSAPPSHPSSASASPSSSSAARIPSNRVGRSSPPPNQPRSSSSTSQPGLRALWRAEGMRFLFAGAAGPILGLAFIDSAFFGLYGRVMQGLHQDRQDPSALSRVFLAGATAGGLCAMLETPIEVVKCRAQVESGAGAKLGSFKIASMIARKEGLRGFYIGGLMTAIHDGISSGIFFWGYFVFRRLLRSEAAFSASLPPPPSPSTSLAQPDAPKPSPAGKTFTDGKMNRAEVGRILLAGGLAGALSAVVPYPFDIIKTRLQTSNFEARASSPSSSSAAATPSTAKPIISKHLSIRSVASGIHQDGVTSHRFTYRTSLLYSFLSRSVFPPASIARGGKADPRAEKWTLRVLGLKGYARGLRPTVVSSFVGSAVTITTFELALHWLGGESTGGVG